MVLRLKIVDWFKLIVSFKNWADIINWLKDDLILSIDVRFKRERILVEDVFDIRNWMRVVCVMSVMR